VLTTSSAHRAAARTTSFTAGQHKFSLVGGGDEAGAGTQPPPPATQLGYEEDPNAERYKAELMSKLLGEHAPPDVGTAVGAGAPRGRTEERVTLRDVSQAAAAATGAAGRRGMRKR